MEENESIDYASLFGIEEDAQESGDETGQEETDTTQTDWEDEPREKDDSEADADEDDSDAQEDDVSERRAQNQVDPVLEAVRLQAQRERDAAIQVEKAESQKAMDAFVAALGINNPYTGKIIQTKAEYDAYQQEHFIKQREKFMQANGMTAEAYDQFVQSLPEVQQANQTIQKANEAEKQARSQQAKAILNEQIAMITQQDPSVRTVEDLMAADNYDQIYGLVQKGYALSDAFKLINFDRLTNQVAEASRQKVINQDLGKRHLNKTQTRGDGSVEVPREIKQAYLDMMPNATDAEIRAHWAKYIKH